MILEVHRITTTGTLEDPSEEGAFRGDDEVRVNDRRTGQLLHVPPTHAEISTRVKALCKFANGRSIVNGLQGPARHPTNFRQKSSGGG